VGSEIEVYLDTGENPTIFLSILSCLSNEVVNFHFLGRLKSILLEKGLIYFSGEAFVKKYQPNRKIKEVPCV